MHKEKISGTRGLVLIAALASCALLSVDTWADSITIHLRTPEGVPIPGHLVSLYLDPSQVVITSATTNAAGDVTLTDAAFEGQFRCAEIAAKPGYSFAGNGINFPKQTTKANPVCANAFGIGEFFFWGSRLYTGSVSVVGGEGGYVNPNRNETAKIIITPGDRGTADVRIYTARGRLIASKSRLVEDRIQNIIEWDGRNAEGQMVASGIYIAHVIGPSLNMKVKIAIVKK